MAHINSRSLVHNFEALRHVVDSMNCDVMAITETWLRDTISENQVYIEGYTFLRHDRAGDRGGGVGMYIRNALGHQVLPINVDMEGLFVEVRIRSMTLIVGVIYRPPGANVARFLDSLENVISTVLPVCDLFVCLGDVNINLLDSESNSTALFTEFIDSFSFTQLIEEPTRVTATTSTLIDVIFTNDKKFISSSGVNDSYDVADHHLIFCRLTLPAPVDKPIFKVFRDYRNINYTLFNEHLRSMPWRNIFDIPRVDDKVNFINDNVTALLDLHAPLRTCKITRRPCPWLTGDIKFMMEQRNRALRTFKRTKLARDWDDYRRLRNLTNSTVVRAKKNFFNALFVKSDYRSTWKDLNRFSMLPNRCSTGVPPHLGTVDEINNFFLDSLPDTPRDAETFAGYVNNLLPELKSTLAFETVDESCVLRIILSMKSGAVGADGIGVYVLRLCVPFLLPYVTHVINCSISSCVFPSAWKRALVTPIPKVPSPANLSNLRPISVLPVLSKILEKILNSQLRCHLEKNNILPGVQSGFRPGFGCHTALLSVTDDIIAASDAGKLTIAVFLDYSRAFDTVDHQLLLAILRYIGLSDASVELMSSFLDGRQQAVCCGGVTSGWRAVTRGVVQGSIMGPQLFSVYISQMGSVMRHCKFHCYADDTQIYLSFPQCAVRDACRRIEEDLQALSEFSRGHCLKLNAQKSAAMVFGRKVDRQRVLGLVDIVVDGAQINIKEEFKNLGVYIDNTFRYKRHVSNCMQRAYCNLRKIYSIRGMLNVKSKSLLCDSLVLSIFNYCDVVYSSCLDSRDRVRIQRVQNSCLRLVYGVRKYDRVTHKLGEIGWLSMANRRLLHSACFYRKVMIDRCPPYLYEKITFRTDVHALNLRYRGGLTPPKHNTEFYKRCFTYCIAKTYNGLPCSLRSVCLSTFRQRMKQKLLSSQ